MIKRSKKTIQKRQSGIKVVIVQRTAAKREAYRATSAVLPERLKCGELPSCGGWQLNHLARHLIEEHRFEYCLLVPDAMEISIPEFSTFLRDLPRRRPSFRHVIAQELMINKGHADPKGSQFRYFNSSSGVFLSRRAIELISEVQWDSGQDVMGNDRAIGGHLANRGFLPDLLPHGMLRHRDSMEPHNEGERVSLVKLRFTDSKRRIKGWINIPFTGDLASTFPDGCASHIHIDLTERLNSDYDLSIVLRTSHRLLSQEGRIRLDKCVDPSTLLTKEHGSARRAIEAAEFRVDGMWYCKATSKEFRPLIESASRRSRGRAGRLVSIQAAPFVHLEKRRERIAFLFLCRSEPNQSILWKEFFDGQQGLYDLYLHAKHPHAVRDEFWARAQIDEHFHTHWGGPSLVSATLAMLEAAFACPLNRKFVLISEACVPIKPFRRVCQDLLAEERGIMHWYKPEKVKEKDPAKAARLEHAYGVPKKHWFLHDQWVCLNRKAAQLLIENEMLWKYENVFAPDECYIATTLSTLRCNLEDDFENRRMTHVDWEKGNCFEHPYTYSTLSPKDFEDFRISPCHFARKFSVNSNIRAARLHVE